MVRAAHMFMIPGMVLNLILARHVAKRYQDISLNQSGGVIAVSDGIYQNIMATIGKAVRSTRPVGYLADFLAGPDPGA